jgi:MoaA/NifB/PqqE/SkfB family radical SAM enzyme
MWPEMVGKSSDKGFSIALGLTNDCNLACAHCYRATGRIDRLSLDDIRRILRKCPELFPKVVDR